VMRRTPKGGALVDRWILKVPFFGQLFPMRRWHASR